MKSFTTEIKEELIDLDLSKEEDIAELSGFIRNNSIKLDKKIDIKNENMLVIKRMYTLFKKNFNILAKNYTEINKIFNKNHIYHLRIDQNLDFILKDLNIVDDNNNILEKVEDYLIDDDLSKLAYLRGVFLTCGSVNDPKKSRYHLEFITSFKDEAVVIQRLLNHFDLNSRIIKRDVKFMIYIKEAEKISDFLKMIHAYKSVLYYENVRVYREQKNLTNRLNNMEQANTEKTMSSALKQLEDIDFIIRIEGIDNLDKRTKEACEYRLKYPESSFSELSEIMKTDGINITKSGLSHRFRKIAEEAEYLRKKIARSKK
jgi:hypothetical protein